MFDFFTCADINNIFFLSNRYKGESCLSLTKNRKGRHLTKTFSFSRIFLFEFYASRLPLKRKKFPKTNNHLLFTMAVYNSSPGSNQVILNEQKKLLIIFLLFIYLG